MAKECTSGLARICIILLLSICTNVCSSALPLQRTKTPYWEDLSPTEQEKVLKSPSTIKDAVAYYKQSWKPADNQRTFDLLNDLITFQDGGDTEKFYLHIFNEILLGSDGALAEVMGEYCMQMIQKNPPFTLAYFTRDEEVQDRYANAIGYELSFYDDASNPGGDFKKFKKRLEAALPKEVRKQNNKTLTEFYNTIEKAIEDARK